RSEYWLNAQKLRQQPPESVVGEDGHVRGANIQRLEIGKRAAPRRYCPVAPSGDLDLSGDPAFGLGGSDPNVCYRSGTCPAKAKVLNGWRPFGNVKCSMKADCRR